MQRSCDLPFENIMIKAPVDYQEFLTFVFGEDYMVPPPKEERMPKHPATVIKTDTDQ